MGANSCAETCVCKLAPPFTKKERFNPDAERQKYVIDKNKKYVFGCAARTSRSYVEIVDETFDMLSTGMISCKFVAVKAMQPLVVSKARELADTE